MSGVPFGTLTFLFTDIEGSTKLWEEQPQGMQVALAHHDSLLEAIIEDHNGYIFKTVGDAFYAAFTNALDALTAALTCQEALAAEVWHEAIGSLRVRMALHTGFAEERQGDYFGPTVNRVARLLSAGHGGQVILSAATRVLVRNNLPSEVSLVDCGEHYLKDLAQPEHIFQVIIPNLPSGFPPLRTAGRAVSRQPGSTTDTPVSQATTPETPATLSGPGLNTGSRHNLPSQPTPFFGRVEELAAIRALLTDASCRLLTLVGTGGIGKTRLSLQAAIDHLEHFSDGVYFIPLAPVNAPDFIIPTMVESLRLPVHTQADLQTQLLSYLRDKTILLVMDNFEHLVEGTALIEEILNASPAVKILVTSRERLNLREETILDIQGLKYPESEQITDIESYSAVQLFLRSARRVHGSFSLTDEEKPDVSRICRLVDGMPLGVELAATWTRMLSCREIAQEIERSLDFLTSNLRNIPERHRSMRAIFEHSWNLLSEAERQIFQRLSVFRGGFRKSAAEVVAGASLPMLSSLVDKSLLRVNGVGRYEIHELLKQYANEKLLASGDMQQTRDAHLRYFTQFAEEAEPKLGSPEQAAWISQLEIEHDNLRAALEWCQHEQKHTEAGLRIAAALRLFWRTGGTVSEGLEYLDELLARSGVRSAAIWAKALAAAGWLAVYQGDSTGAVAFSQESLALAQQDQAQENKRSAALALNVLGTVARSDKEYTTASMRYEEALTLSRELADTWLMGLSFGNQGIMAFYQQDYERSEVLFEECLALYREIDSYADIVILLNLLARLARRHDDYERAAALCNTGLGLSWERRDKLGMSLGLSGLAGVCAQKGQLQQAACLFGAEEALREAINTGLLLGIRADHEHTVAAVRAQLDETTFTRAWAEGRVMALEQTIAYAQESLIQEVETDAPLDQQKGHGILIEHLTEREFEVLQLLNTGMSNQDIAQKLIVTEGTVKRHTHQIFAKLGVRNRTQAILHARELNLL